MKFCIIFGLSLVSFIDLSISSEISSLNFDNLKSANLTFVLSGRNLPRKDRFSEVDPFVKLFHRKGNGPDVRFGTTSHVIDNPNPEWLQAYWFSWEKGTEQKWHFVVRDHDRLAPDDPVGDVIIDVDDYVSKGQDVNATMSDGGYLIVQKTEPFSFRLFAASIPNKDGGSDGKSDVYVKMFWRRGPTGTANLFRKSSIAHEATDSSFQFEEIEFSNYQPGTNQYFYFQLYDHDAFTTDDFIGDLQVQVDDLKTNKTTFKAPLDHSDGKATLAIHLI